MNTQKMLRAVLVYSYHKRRQEDAEQKFDAIRQRILQKTSDPRVMGVILTPHIVHLRSVEEETTRAGRVVSRFLQT